MKLLPHRFAEMLSAHRDIALVAADLDLRAFFNRVPFLISAEIHGGLIPIRVPKEPNEFLKV